ncbi:TIGR02530 family flagellar biosynthesis protein [Anaerosporobacter sp.]
MDIRNKQYTSIEQMTGQYLHNRKITYDKSNIETTLSFKELFETTKQNGLEKKVESSLKFSKHANQRIESRNIDLSGEVLQRLEDGTRIAQQKGIKESLVMIDNMAFIVNVPNSTVVTAVDKNENKVFTNIDGAVIA